ncbi:hypothetical protein RZS08_00570, partial [Arthrospira platensis SPKY1]|nr:hypothetical protein [Arthrospira platensis SPKY1]
MPLVALVKKFAHMRFEPSGFTASQDIPHAKSILDYIFRWLGLRFLGDDEKALAGITSQLVDVPHEDESESRIRELSPKSKLADSVVRNREVS